MQPTVNRPHINLRPSIPNQRFPATHISKTSDLTHPPLRDTLGNPVHGPGITQPRKRWLQSLVL